MNRDSRHHEPSTSKRPFRSPQRITITIPHGAYQRLLERSDQEGRSLSNLAAFLLEGVLASRGGSGSSFI